MTDATRRYVLCPRCNATMRPRRMRWHGLTRHLVVLIRWGWA